LARFADADADFVLSGHPPVRRARRRERKGHGHQFPEDSEKGSICEKVPEGSALRARLILTSAGAATGHAKSSARALAAAVISDTPVRIAVSTFLLIEADPVSSSQQKLRESC
jgi:hypothetical protein